MHVGLKPKNTRVVPLELTATLLVRITVLSMKLLPFYDKGTVWWALGARLFLDTQFTHAFAWPHFQQPRLCFQLAARLFVVTSQLFGRATNWLLWR